MDVYHGSDVELWYIIRIALSQFNKYTKCYSWP